MRYDHRHRPAQPPTPAADAFEVRHGPEADGVRIAYVRAGEGGYPLVLIHGYPETSAKQLVPHRRHPTASSTADGVLTLASRTKGAFGLRPCQRHR